MSVSDTAVGAILEIPPQALRGIRDAERAIWSLHDASKKAADQVYGDFGERMPRAFDKFIQKIREASGVIDGINGKTVNINATGLEQSMTQAANTAQTQSQRISDSVQGLSRLDIDTTNLKTIAQSVEDLRLTYQQLEQEVKNYEAGRKVMQVDTPESQAMNNVIEKLKEFIALKKKSEEQLARATTPSDKAVLDEQKSLMSQILQLTKDINAENKKQEREKALGRTIPQEDIDRLRKYREDLEKLNISYDTLKGKIDGMSAGGAKLFNEADVKNSLALTREQGNAQEKLNQALQMTAKLTSDVKLKGGNVTSSEYGVYRNEQVTVYAQMIEMIKKKGEVEAQVAQQGYAQTVAQTNLLKTIAAEYRRLESSLTSVTGKYLEIDRAVKSAFENTKTLQEAENAAKLADAYAKAAEAANKKSKADEKAEKTDLSKDRTEYKQVLSLIEQVEKAQRKVNDALASATLPANLAQHLQNSSAAAEAALNTLYNRRAEIEAKRGQELADIQQQNEAKKGAAAVAEYEKAEKEKTRISRQEATDRYNEEMRQRRLTNAELTAQGKQQRMDINDAREKRQIELTEQRRHEVERLRQEIDKLDKRDVNYQRDLDRLNQRINELLGTTQRRVEYTREEAMAMAKSAATLKQLEDAYRALKDAMSKADPTSKEWTDMNTQLRQTKKNIDDIKKKMGEFHNEVQRTSNMMGQLQSRIAAAFSISAITGFAKKATEIRAQFELQRVALGAIIQDKDEANKVFLRVQQMALESPFSIMQLERSTKQVAAFGFEAKQLVPTMKMVADIGAGLGVELDRIVLVLGHMKARGYLEGTMVRQFTNMGFNVLGELAKYYTELEGRMVSVADVQERVKKKMVEFGDVEEVLKRVTSAGGMFYDMQKKQSDSIWGQMQRITDAYDLMLNEIGQQNEAGIKAALTAIRSLINSWRTLMPIIKSVGAAMMLYFARVSWRPMVAGIAKMTSGFNALRTMTWGAKAAQDALNASQKASGWGTLIALIGAAVVAIWEFATAQSKLNEELERTQSEGISDMYGLIFQYRTLADTVKDSTKSYDERKKALDELKRVYKDILPDYMTEVNYIKSITDGYTEATDAIKAYSEAKIRKNMQDAIDAEFGKNIQEAIATNAESFTTEIYRKISDLAQLEGIDKNTLKGAVANIMTVIAEEVKNGTLTTEEATSEFQKRFMDSLNLSDADLEKVANETGSDINRIFSGVFDDKYTGSWFGTVSSGLNKVFDKLFDTKGKITNLGLTSSVLTENAQPAIDQYHNLEKAVAEYTAALEALYNRKADLEKQGGTFGTVGVGEVDGERTFTFPGADSITQDAMDEVYNKLGLLQSQVGAYGEEFVVTTQDINRALQSNMDQTEYMGIVNQNVLQKVLNNFNKWGGVLINNPFMKNFVEDSLKNLNLLTESQKKIIDIARKVATANGVAMNSFDLLKISAASNYTDAAKEAKKLSDQAADNIQKIAATRTQLLLLAKLNHQFLTTEQAQAQAEQMWGAGKTEEELKTEQKAYEQLWKALGGYEKSSQKSGRQTDKELKRWQDLKKAIEDVSTAYDKARKSFSAEESNRQIEALFGSTFKELGYNIKDFYKNGTYDAKSLIDALEVLLGMTKATTEERKKFRSEMQRKIADTQVEIDVKLREDAEKKLKDDLDKMFDNYELSKTFKGVGMNVDLTYMVGGKPTTLADIRAEINKLRREGGGKADAENRIKILEDAEKKLMDIQHKNQVEQIKNYHKYLLESMSDRVQIELKAMEDIAKIRDDETLDQFSKEQAIANRRKKMQEDLAKETWKSFQGTDSYINMFKDVDKASTTSINRMLKKLDELKGSLKHLPADQVKAIVREMEKLKDVAAERKPFSSLINGIKEYIAYLQKRGELEKRQADLENLQSDTKDKIAETEKIVFNLQTQYDAQKNNAEASQAETDELKARLDYQKNYLQMLKQQYKMQGKELEGINEEISDGEEAGNKTMIAFQKIKKYAEETVGYIDNIIQSLDKMGLISDEVRDNFESFKEGFETVNQIAEGGIRVLEGWGQQNWAEVGAGTLQGIAGTFKLIAAAFSIGDKKKEREIQNLTKSVERLEYAYKKLEKAIESAYTFIGYNEVYRRSIKNINAQKQAYQEMIRLEEAKKKTDDEKVQEYKDKLDELAEAEEELRKQRIEAMGSTTDYLNEAVSFVETWLDAYREVGDGTDALKEHWDEFLDSLVIKQAAAALVSTRIKKVIDTINDAIDSGKTGLDLATIVRNATADFKGQAGTLNAALKEFFDAFGVNLGTGGEYVLSDLQKGIQNITEPQAAAIEAYLNSIRFAVFQHTEQLNMLIASVQMQYGSGGENPVVTELKGIRGVLDTIDRRLSSVIDDRIGSAVIRVG